jgi:hypothetical protein
VCEVVLPSAACSPICVPVQEQYRVLNAQLTANVAVVQALRRNTPGAARSASEALSLLNNNGNGDEARTEGQNRSSAKPLWKTGPPLPVPEIFAMHNSEQDASVRAVLNRALNGAPVGSMNNHNGSSKINGRVERSSGAKVSPLEKILEAAVHDMDACGEVSLRSEAGRRVLEVRRAAWEAQISCVQGMKQLTRFS